MWLNRVGVGLLVWTALWCCVNMQDCICMLTQKVSIREVLTVLINFVLSLWELSVDISLHSIASHVVWVTACMELELT